MWQRRAFLQIEAGTMQRTVIAAVLVLLIVVAALWTIFPLDGPTQEDGQPPPHAIDQSE